jgi:hypothetical protein
LQQQSLEEYVQSKLTEKKAMADEVEAAIKQSQKEVRVESSLKDYIPTEGKKGDDEKAFVSEVNNPNNYDYMAEYYEDQRALQESEEDYEGWYQEAYYGVENGYTNASMGPCFREFAGTQPFSYAQQMYPQQCYPMMYPQGQYFYPQLSDSNGRFIDQPIFHQQFQFGPSIYNDKIELDMKVFIRTEEQPKQPQPQQKQQQQQQPPDSKGEKEAEKEPKK